MLNTIILLGFNTQEECAPCQRCGWDMTVPCCPLEYNDTPDATWKEWRPRIEKDGKSYQEELVTRTAVCQTSLARRCQAWLGAVELGWAPPSLFGCRQPAPLTSCFCRVQARAPAAS